MMIFSRSENDKEKFKLRNMILLKAVKIGKQLFSLKPKKSFLNLFIISFKYIFTTARLFLSDNFLIIFSFVKSFPFNVI